MTRKAKTSGNKYKSKQMKNFDDFKALEKHFENEDLEQNQTKVIVDPDFIKIGEDIGEFLNKFQSWFFISKVAKIDFSNWIEFMIIKKKLLKIIKRCTGLQILNLSYCNKDWDDVHLNFKNIIKSFRISKSINLEI